METYESSRRLADSGVTRKSPYFSVVAVTTFKNPYEWNFYRLSGMFEALIHRARDVYRLSEMFLPAIGDVFYRLSEMPFTGYRRCLLAATPTLARLCSTVNTRARLTKLFFNVLTHRRYPPHPAEQHGNVRITPREKIPPPSAGANRASRWTTPKPNKWPPSMLGGIPPKDISDSQCLHTFERPRKSSL